MDKIDLECYVGTFLPKSISDAFHAAEDIARWLEENGHEVTTAQFDPNYTAYAETRERYVVCRNGYVWKRVTPLPKRLDRSSLPRKDKTDA